MASQEFEDDSIVVTGGANGMGQAYVRRFCRRGASVAVLDPALTSDDDIAAFVDEIAPNRGDQLHCFDTDVTDYEAVVEAVQTFHDRTGGIDVLVANAGGGDGEMEETFASDISVTDIRSTVERNLYGTMFSCMAVAPVMKSQESGRIVTVSSQAARMIPQDGSYAHYGAAKAAVTVYSKYLAQELGPYGVTVNVLAPGFIETKRLTKTFERIGVDKITDKIALNRVGDIETCVEAVEFLASERSSFITGAVIPVDGGSTRSGTV